MAGEAAMPKAPVSSRLSQMGFMKRAAKRKAEEAVAVAEEPSVHIKEEHAEQWTAEDPATNGCIVIVENDPEPGAASGRFSFNGANEQVEEQKIKQDRENGGGNTQEIGDEEMQEQLAPHTKRRKSAASNPGSSGKQKQGQKTRYFEA